MSGNKFPVPDGFESILHDFAREVLRDNPDNVYEYGWLYFNAIKQGIPFEYKNKGMHMQDFLEK